MSHRKIGTRYPNLNHASSFGFFFYLREKTREAKEDKKVLDILQEKIREFRTYYRKKFFGDFDVTHRVERTIFKFLAYSVN